MTLTPAQYSKAQRWLLTTLGGLGVAALAAGTFVLSYDDLRLLALRGGAAHHWAFLYPWMLDGLVVVIILAILTARRSNWSSRTIRWLLLVLLIGGAGAAGVQRAVKGYATLPDTPVNVGVAVAPWAILIIAVWLWVSMFKHLLGLRARRVALSPTPGPAGAVESVPAALVDQPIIPGLGSADTRQLPLPSSVRELEPVREESRPDDEPLAPPAPSEPEPNPWDAARIDPPQDDAEPPEIEKAEETGYPEPSDPVPASWLAEPELSPGDLTAEDDTQPLPTRTEPAGPLEASWTDEAYEPDTREPEPLLPPARSPREERDDAPHEETAPMTDEPAEDDTAPRWVARPFLPTDVRLVGGPKPVLCNTQPDGFQLPDTNPDGFPTVAKPNAARLGDDEDDGYADERAEDPDAGDDLEPWEESRRRHRRARSAAAQHRRGTDQRGTRSSW